MSESYIQNLFAERIGGKQYGKSTAIYKFEKIKRAKRAALAANPGGEIIDMGVELNIIQKSGSWFSYNGDKLGQGRDTVKQLLVDNPELATEVEQKIREKLKELQLA